MKRPLLFLVRNKLSPQNYLIIPRAHRESVQDLPDNWWADMKQLLAAVPDLPADYNISINIGKQAGQTLGHLHFWVIPRAGDVPAAGKGLAKLIDEANQE